MRRPSTGRWLRDGDDPDPRFTLANERTYLAWIRTALALVAGGVGLEAFVVDMPPVLRRVLAAGLVLLGAALAVGAFVRWVATERALRARRSLPLPALVPLLSAGVALTSLVLLVTVLTKG